MKSLLPLILIIVAIGFFFFQVNPLRVEVSSLRSEAKEYDEALTVADQLKEVRANLTQTLESFSQADITRLDHFLPRNLDTVRIILDVDSIAAQSGIRLQNLKVTDAAPQDGAAAIASQTPYNTISVTFGFNASYAQGLQFIENLQKSLRLFENVGLTVKPSIDPNFYDFEMALETYWVNR